MLFLKKNIKENLFLYLVILISIIIICSVLFLNDIVYHIKLLELKAFLKEINRENSTADYLSLVAKYKLHKELYENKIKYPDFDKQELKISSLIINFQNQDKILLQKYNKASIPVFHILNFLRFFLNKPSLQQIINNPIDEELIIGYYYERNSDYHNALNLYDKLMRKYKATDSKKLVINLHEGFCYSIIGEYDKAKEKYLYIIRNYNNENIALTAAILLRYLENFQDEIKRIRESDMPDIDKSEHLYKMIAYKDALEILNKIQSKDKEEQSKLNYLKARCLEETNKKLESIKIYQKIIMKNSESEYAKYANSRLLIISSINENGRPLKELSIKNNELINDSSFNKILEESNNIKKINFNQKLNRREETNPNEKQDNNSLSISNVNEFIKNALKAIESHKTDDKKNQSNLKKTIDKSKLIETIINENNNKKGLYTKEYRDKNGTIYRAELYDKNDILLYYYIYEYDESGNSISVLGYDADGNPLVGD